MRLSETRWPAGAGVLIVLAFGGAMYVTAAGARPVVVAGTLITAAGVYLSDHALRRDARRRQEALHASEARFRALIENSADLITVLDAAGLVVYQSPASMRVLGRAPEHLVGTSQLDLVHPDDREALASEIERTRDRPAHAFHLEVRVRHADGSWRTLASDARARLDDPAVGGIVVNSRDVTRERLTEDQLRHAQKMEAVGRLAGGIAHDFNNALTAIRGLTELAREDLPPGSPLRTDLDEVIRSSESATSITRQLLAFSRQQILQPRVVDLDRIVEGVTKMLRRVIGEDVGLRTALACGDGRVLADPGQIEQLVMNLAVNARDAMPGGGTLTIETRAVELRDEPVGCRMEVAPGPYLMLTVRDTGVGMTAEVRERVFEPFFTTKAQGRGTGLGLSMVYGIVRQSGGCVRVKSAPGEGATFEVLLPRLDPQDLPRVSTPPAPLKTAEGAGTVLLVEDESAVRAFVRRVLARRGWQVLEAATGDEALALMRTHGGDVRLLITDVVMPGMSGAALAERVRADHPHVPVLFTSGYTSTEIADRGVLPPDVELLEKPFTTEALLRKVADLTSPR